MTTMNYMKCQNQMLPRNKQLTFHYKNLYEKVKQKA